MTDSNLSTQFDIPKDGYLSFDALTLKTFIKDRLNDNRVFTDQNYEGSYLTVLNEIIAYTFHTLLFYLNRTSTESMYSESQIYENMNRIVKLIDYKPIGQQTASVTYGLSASSSVDPGIYTIPRYSNISNGTIHYSTNEDIVVSKTTTQNESLDNIVSQKLLFQGKYVEYPVYTSTGNTNEVVFLAPGDNVIVDHFNIDVYVFERSTSQWYQWSRSPSLYLENGVDRVFEIRLNEDQRYELRFGNDINGKQLRKGDIVQMYYLDSKGTAGEVGRGGITQQSLRVFSGTNFSSILEDLNSQAGNAYTYLTSNVANNFKISNTNDSTYYQDVEDVESIRKNAPGIFRSQYRVVTEEDFENYIKTNFANLIHDIKTVNNWTYLTEQMRYYYDEIGLKDPNNVSNLLYNQLNFADACNFNNIYITAVPKTVPATKNPTSNLTPAQKELIISSIRNVKPLTTEVVILDPVFIATDISIPLDGRTQVNLDDKDNTELSIIKDPSSRRDDNSIIADASTIFQNYFNRENIKLGQTLSVTELTNSLLSIAGVKNIYTRRTDDPTVQVPGLSLVTWNPVYPTDNLLVTKNTAYSYFKYLFLNDSESFKNKIKVTTATKIYENIEY